MIRFLDIVFSITVLILLCPFLIVIIIIGYFDTGSPFFIQTRVGKGMIPFKLIKFRSMKKNTSSLPSHLVDKSSVTKFGSFIRRSKIDELPQLLNVIKGDMSLVGPRPCLPDQTELKELREKGGIFQVLPGITGLAQIHNIDMSDPENLVIFESEMIKKFSFIFYISVLLKTTLGSGKGDAVMSK